MVSLARRYYAYRGTLSNGFYLPISVIYMEASGLGLADIGLVQASFLVTMVAAELPTGYLGDRLGRRRALALGNVLLTAVMLGFVVADSTAGFAAVYVLWAVGWTFRTGTADAWLYELLATRDLEDEFARISGRANSVLLLVSAATALGAGVLYTVDPVFPFVANAAVAAAGVPILFTLPRTRVASTDDGAGADADTAVEEQDAVSVRDAWRILRTQLSRASIRWLVAYAALFNVVFSVTRVFEQPAAREVGVPIAGLGALYAGFKLVSAAASSSAGWFRDALGTRGVLLVLVPTVGVLYASVMVVPVLLVPVLFFRRAVQKVTRPVRNEYINDRLADVGRATVLSGVSMALSMASGTANVLGGHVAEMVGPVTFLSATGTAVALAAGVLWLTTRPVREAAPGDIVPS